MDVTIDQTKAPSGAADGAYLTLTRHFAAPRALVFSMWAEPRHMARWCGPRGFTTPVSEGDFRAGGAWCAVLRAPDGTDHRVAGRYLEIVPDRRIVQTHAWLDEDGRPGHETEITVTFEDEAGGTRMTFRQGPFEYEASRDCHADGWAQSLDRLGEYLAETEAAAPAAEAVVRITRQINAPRKLVWAAWTDPRGISNWWGPRGFTTTTKTFDFTVGGIWRFTMHGPDGTDYPNRIEYLEITPPARLVYAHSGEDKVDEVKFHSTVDLTEAEGGTRVTLTLRFASIAERDHVVAAYGAVEGGRETLARLAEHLGAA